MSTSELRSPTTPGDPEEGNSTASIHPGANSSIPLDSLDSLGHLEHNAPPVSSIPHTNTASIFNDPQPNGSHFPKNSWTNGSVMIESNALEPLTALEQLQTLSILDEANSGNVTPPRNAGLTQSPDDSEIKDSDSELGSDEAEPVEVDEDEVRKRVSKAGFRKIGRKWQTENFQQWAAKKHLGIVEAPRDTDLVNDEHKSSKELLRYTTKSIISDPREYQLELYERAKQKNTIAVLDTGSGKTLIATLLIRHVLDQELEDRAKGKPPRVCVFLVANVTLVFQQAAVLDCNLDTRIGRYCGEMGVDLWNKTQWNEVFLKDRVVVATADTIFNCLTHAFLKMDQINLLVFDECHHAKKSHVYARIMRDFYNPLPETERPKVFGMTASPVDARVDVTKAASGLETHLHSEICTASDLSLLQRVIQLPHEEALLYPKLELPRATDLIKKLVDFKEVDCLQPIFRFARAASSELGPWCADEVWKFCLTEIEQSKLERRLDIKSNSGAKPEDPVKIENDIKKIRAARAVVAKHTFARPGAKELSSKVLILLRYLQAAYKNCDSDMKCIVFVTRRYTAKVLELLLKELKAEFPGLRFGVLFGTSGFSMGNDSMTFKEQTFTLHKFRKGALNCLIATAVAEEGLDIPDCNLVIRFDLYSTMIQYIQSRGRARHSSSKYIHMAEEGNTTHMQLIKDVKEAEKLMKKFCSVLPSERLLDIPMLPFINYDDDEDYQITIPSTGAKLTLSSSMQILGHFVDKLFSDGHSQFGPTYAVQPIFGKGYKCEVILPEEAPITNIEGPARASKSAAKQAAAFEAVKKLVEKKYLDDHLLPTVREKIRPLMANAHLAVDLFKVNSYSSKVKAPFWDIPKDEQIPKELHFTCFYVKQDEDQPFGVNKFQPILLVTRKRLPDFPHIPLYSDRGDNLVAESVQLRQVVVEPSEELIAKINTFTDRFFVDVFNKVFDIKTENMPYWLLPLQYEITFKEHLTIEEIVDWDLVHVCQTQDSVLWDPSMPDSVAEEKFFIDRGQGSRRFFTHNAVPDMNIYTPIPEGACTAPFVANVIDYSFSAGKKGWGKWKDEVPEKQPVLRSDRVLHRINWLDPPSKREQSQQTLAFVCPSPFRISNLPVAFVKMGLIFPSISSRLEGYLHAAEVCRLLGVEISLDLALEAITKDSENTSEHGEEQVNKQRGMADNYERLEFLGDCFLKMGTTIALYSQHPEDDEFEYHVKRMLLICNKNLFERAKEIKLYRYIQTEGFSRRLWYPAIQMLKGKGHTKDTNLIKTRVHKLGDKTIADVCEALIGAALHDRGFDMATRLITNLLNNPLHQVSDFRDYYNLYKIPEYQSADSSESQKDLARQIEEETGYKFKYPRILRSAFTHPSVPNIWEKIPCYQRLEFLGDALIDQACVNYLWNKYPGKDPQWLTEHKMSMINNKFQGMLSVKLGFHRHIRYIGGHMDNAIRDYVNLVKEAATVASDTVDFWTDLKAPPKVLPDVLEAYIGATFVDSGFDFKVVEAFFDKYILPYFTDMTVFDNFAGNHPVTQLTSKFTALGCDDWKIFCQDYKDRDGQRVISACFVHKDVFAEGLATTIKNARVNVAQNAMKRLSKMTESEFYAICNCQTRREHEKSQRESQKAKAKATLQVSRRAAAAAAAAVTLGPTKEEKENREPLKIVDADQYANAPTEDNPKNLESMVIVH